jgi:hypothetical protein
VVVVWAETLSLRWQDPTGCLAAAVDLLVLPEGCLGRSGLAGGGLIPREASVESRLLGSGTVVGEVPPEPLSLSGMTCTGSAPVWVEERTQVFPFCPAGRRPPPFSSPVEALQVTSAQRTFLLCASSSWLLSLSLLS